MRVCAVCGWHIGRTATKWGVLNKETRSQTQAGDERIKEGNKCDEMEQSCLATRNNYGKCALRIVIPF